MNVLKKILSIILFIASIFSLFLTLWLTDFLGNIEIFGLAGFEYLWVAIPVASIPVASLIFGIVARKGRGVIKKNVIIGSIIAPILLVFGLSSFAFKFNRSGAFLKEVSSLTGIVFPKETKCASYGDFGGRVGNALITNERENDRFKASVVGDSRWVAKLPPASKGIIPSFVMLSVEGRFDWHCLYVEPISHFNPAVITPGQYSLTLISYSPSNSHIQVFDTYTCVYAP